MTLFDRTRNFRYVANAYAALRIDRDIGIASLGFHAGGWRPVSKYVEWSRVLI